MEKRTRNCCWTLGREASWPGPLGAGWRVSSCYPGPCPTCELSALGVGEARKPSPPRVCTVLHHSALPLAAALLNCQEFVPVSTEQCMFPGPLGTALGSLLKHSWKLQTLVGGCVILVLKVGCAAVVPWTPLCNSVFLSHSFSLLHSMPAMGAAGGRSADKTPSDLCDPHGTFSWWG